MTHFEIKSLEILKDTELDQGISPREFAEKMWPDSNMHTKQSNQGNGATVGKAAWLCGGSHLSKLKRKGLVWRCSIPYDSMYCISAKGREELRKKTQSRQPKRQPK